MWFVKVDYLYIKNIWVSETDRIERREFQNELKVPERTYRETNITDGV